ncbi:MAG: hypothetical protein JSV83_13080 [Desulfobacterales bacterium]|nr:MAG: hypothetical protein JSV83_13080 [Desulfobacterales bacterium]
MDIIIGRTSSVNKDSSNENALGYVPTRRKRKDRRKNKKDRRKSVRDGVFVSLSFKKERRVLKDRRKNSTAE